MGSVEGKEPGPASLKDVGGVEYELLPVATIILLHSLKEYNSINKLEPTTQITTLPPPLLPIPHHSVLCPELVFPLLFFKWNKIEYLL